MALTSEPASAYLKLGTRSGNVTVNLQWENLPVRYFISNASGGGVSSTQLRDAVDRAFDNWAAVETATSRAEFAGFTRRAPNDDDGLTVIGFVNRAGPGPDPRRDVTSSSIPRPARLSRPRSS